MNILQQNQYSLLSGQNHVLELIAKGAPLSETLHELILLIEAQEPGSRCGILIVTEDGMHFRRGCGPNLPEIYHQALDGVPIIPPYLGACGEVAHKGCPVVIPDIAADQRYSGQWRDLVISCGLAALRSTPVFAADGRALASFALYYSEPRDPDPAHPDLIEAATHLASIALERDEAERRSAAQKAALRESKVRLATELATVQQLQEISTLAIRDGNIDALYQELVEAASVIMRSEAASMQMLDREQNELRLLAWKGFDPASAVFWERVRLDSASTCGAAFLSGARVVVTDVEKCGFMAGTEDLDHYLLSGLHAVQSTPPPRATDACSA